MNKNTQGRYSALAVDFGLEDTGRWPVIRKESGRMYAICFDLDQDALKRHYPGNTHNNGYEDIARVLRRYGFTRQQGSVYFGDQHVTPVTCVMAVQAVQKTHSWFGKVVTDIRMLRIEEHNDLLPAIAQQEFELETPATSAE